MLPLAVGCVSAVELETMLSQSHYDNAKINGHLNMVGKHDTNSEIITDRRFGWHRFLKPPVGYDFCTIYCVQQLFYHRFFHVKPLHSFSECGFEGRK